MAPRGKKNAREPERNPVDDEIMHSDEEEDIQEDDGPPSIDPYEVLGLEQEATADDVKKAYRKLALKHHPDKASEDEKDAANKKFQEIAFAYAVLSNDRRRKRYDLTGSTAETLEEDDEFDWLKFYRQQFEDIVNDEAIERISKEYKGSVDERQDLINAYQAYKGKLDAVYEAVMLSDILVDDDRFRQIIDEEISKGAVESYPAYERENDETRKKAKNAEKKRREDFDKKHGKKEETVKSVGKGKAKKKDAGSMADLAALIQQRQKSRAGNFFDHLEAKYAPKSRGAKRATPMEEPPEEAFQATAERSKRRKQSSRAKKVQDDADEEMEPGEEDIGASEEEEEEEEEMPRKSRKPKTAKKGRGRASAKA